MKYSLAVMLVATWGVAGCGSTDMKSTQDSRTGTSDSVGQGSGDLQAQQPVDCTGNTLWLHGDHETCDQADVEAANGTPTPAPAAPLAGPTTDPQAPASPAAPAAPQAPTATPATPAAPAPAPTPTTPLDPNVVEFHIKAGTGTSGYNTAATPVAVKVGQTLRLFNDDTVVHRLHTSGSPCPHQPGNTAPGASFDCVVTKAIDTTAAPGMGLVYDHDAGPTSLFYLKITN